VVVDAAVPHVLVFFVFFIITLKPRVEPEIRARLGTTAHFCEVFVLKLTTVPWSYLRLIDFCIFQLKAQGPSRTCNESKEEEEEEEDLLSGRGQVNGRGSALVNFFFFFFFFFFITLKPTVE